MLTGCPGRVARLPLPLFLAWLGLLAGAAGDQPQELSGEQTQRFLDRLTVPEHDLLALARPEWARRLELSGRQRRQVREWVTRWIAAEFRSGRARQDWRNKKDDDYPAEEVRQAQQAAEQRSAEAAKLREAAREQIEGLLGEGQKAAFRELRPAAVKERGRIALPEYAGVAVFSPDGTWLAVGSGGKVTLYRMPAGEAAGELPTRAEGGTAESGPQTLAFSRDGKTLAAAWFEVRTRGPRPKLLRLDRPEIVRWDVGRRAETARLTLRGFKGDRAPLAFSPDLRWLATAAAPGVVGIWDGATGAEVATLEGYSPSERVPALPAERQPWRDVSFAFAPDGKTLAASFSWQQFVASPGELGDAGKKPPDNRIKLWDTGTWQERRTIVTFPEAGRASVVGLAFTPDGALLAGGSGRLRLWEAATGRERLALPAPATWVSSLHVPATGKDLVCVSGPGEVMVWDLESQLERAFVHVNPKDAPALVTDIRSSALSPDGRTLVVVAARQSETALVLLSIPPARSEAAR
jgi:hypothetical protein